MDVLIAANGCIPPAYVCCMPAGWADITQVQTLLTCGEQEYQWLLRLDSAHDNVSESSSAEGAAGGSASSKVNPAARSSKFDALVSAFGDVPQLGGTASSAQEGAITVQGESQWFSGEGKEDSTEGEGGLKEGEAEEGGGSTGAQAPDAPVPQANNLPAESVGPAGISAFGTASIASLVRFSQGICVQSDALFAPAARMCGAGAHIVRQTLCASTCNSSHSATATDTVA